MTALICQLLIGVAILYQSSVADIPDCVFEDTVDLTASTKFSNGSYLYEGLLVPPQLIAEYDYIELFEGERKVVERHIRGCVCKIKQCVKFCCHPRADMYQTTADATPQCEDELNEELKYSPLLNITLRNSSRVVMHLLDEFVVQQGIPCQGGYMLMPHMYEEDQWELFEVSKNKLRARNIHRRMSVFCRTARCCASVMRNISQGEIIACRPITRVKSLC